METGEVKERNLTGTDFSMEFPMINEDFTGVKTQVWLHPSPRFHGKLLLR